tara:strand:+ start:338 stop:1282 length:945 start_codon:yes stop_codon:yes gene_type:complete
MNLGYACINMTMSSRPKKSRVTTNRSMIRRTFDAKGLPYVSELALQNCYDLEAIMEWNQDVGIRFFRLSSNLFPWASEYEFEDLPDWELIKLSLQRTGQRAAAWEHRITCHPGPFNKLASGKENVVLNTIKDLEIHGRIFDAMGLPRSPYAKINIHVGAAYGDKPVALATFCRNFHRLSDSVKSRLTVENDDNNNLYSTRELYESVYKAVGVPIVHDLHHHTFCTGGLSNADALAMAASTWGDVKPVVHYSQSRTEEKNDTKIRANAHSDSYWSAVNTFGHDVDVMLECKHKEVGLFKMRDLLNTKKYSTTQGA